MKQGRLLSAVFAIALLLPGCGNAPPVKNKFSMAACSADRYKVTASFLLSAKYTHLKDPDLQAIQETSAAIAALTSSLESKGGFTRIVAKKDHHAFLKDVQAIADSVRHKGPLPDNELGDEISRLRAIFRQQMIAAVGQENYADSKLELLRVKTSDTPHAECSNQRLALQEDPTAAQEMVIKNIDI